MNTNKKGSPFLIIFGAILIVFGLSFVSWSTLSCKRVKDYNMLSELFPESVKATAEEIIDPELAAALAELNAHSADTTTTVALSEVVEEKEETIVPKQFTGNTDIDGTVIFEDYTPSGAGLQHLSKALARAESQPVRIGVIGDSYIEGDILTMNMRETLQSRYGGAGVGYMPAFSELTGFRTTVTQKCNDSWHHHEIRKNMSDGMKTIQGEYYTSNGNGEVSYAGTSAFPHLKNWDKSMVLAVAPSGGTVSIVTDAGEENAELLPGEQVQAVVLPGHTSNAKIKASNGVDVLGVYLDSTTGVSVDNMSLRGNSGQTHRKLSVDRASQMRKFVDYDLIIVEYGINALSSQQSNYTGYKNLMRQTLTRLKECYPEADIVMMGIGDRGQKIGGVVKSIPTSQNMVDAQRSAAMEAGVLFWDTRQAMGGEDSVVDWREKGFINSDYIHLNAKGGRALSELFIKALNKNLAH